MTSLESGGLAQSRKLIGNELFQAPPKTMMEAWRQQPGAGTLTASAANGKAYPAAVNGAPARRG